MFYIVHQLNNGDTEQAVDTEQCALGEITVTVGCLDPQTDIDHVDDHSNIVLYLKFTTMFWWPC
jgi:hypothetical protein